MIDLVNLIGLRDDEEVGREHTERSRARRGELVGAREEDARARSLASRDDLRERIVRLSGEPLSPHELIPTGWPEHDEALGGGLARRGVHEWFAVGDRERLRLPPMGALMEIAWRVLEWESRTAPARRRRVVWIGRACHPPAAALVRGLRGVVDGRRPSPDAALLERSILVDASTPQERSWAIEQAARCPGVCAVIADGAGFDTALSRRVQLAAQGSSLVLLARLDRERDARSVALTRWLVSPRTEGESAPERSWHVHLLRSKQPTAEIGAPARSSRATPARAEVSVKARPPTES